MVQAQNKTSFVTLRLESGSERDCLEDEAQQELDHKDSSDDELVEFSFRFESAGQLIAAYNDEEFFIGEVSTVLSADEGEVNFLS